ncbi:LOW QUALITY PROTEIN: uncharacterized protein QC761_106260 [Podospora bellae-mahoneyi]|uniref:Uncharacterized protein n=1 Tax=Podospora bellae-mahoneyi TaxID=2093777 RepID=A0ABR0FXR5_9PEZI|nr:LOW QUALITY PROTEIN: hypothetical protein QC761_106260 [Podospora bellae-mahoneyi]
MTTPPLLHPILNVWKAPPVIFSIYRTTCGDISSGPLALCPRLAAPSYLKSPRAYFKRVPFHASSLYKHTLPRSTSPTTTLPAGVLSYLQIQQSVDYQDIYQDIYSEDELSMLLARQLNFNNPLPAQPEQVPEPVAVAAPQPVQAPKIVYISQHYNHSAAHLAKQKEQQQQQQETPARPSSEPPQSEHAAIERVLREYSVDSTNLSPAQFHLFKTVDDPQRMHLIELWRACPPTPPTPLRYYNSTTSLDQEEALARMRWEQAQQDEMEAELQAQLEHEYQIQMEEQQRQQQQGQRQQEMIISLDGTPLTPVQVGDGRWIQTTAEYGDMEPYMATGYQEELARRGVIGTGTGGSSEAKRATDPVYKSVGVDWASIRRREEEYQMSMSEQYGRLMLARGVEDEEDEEML